MSFLPTCANGDSGYKAYRLGTHRAIPPAETLARLRPLLREMGITRVANVTGLDRIGIPVIMVCRPNSRSIAVAQGKGLSLDAAKASGLMEAIETWHAERINRPLTLAGYNDLQDGHPLVHVDRLPPIAGSRYQPNLSMLWIEGFDLIANAPVWVPYEVVHADFRLPQPTGSGCFPASTNGLASGNHRFEAISHAICEVVERDSTSLWHRLGRAGRDRTRVDLATIRDEACCEVLGKLEHAGLAVGVWETTTDVAVAAFNCVILDEAVSHPGYGAGCHPTREIALLRALTEAVQVRMTYITGARDDLPREQYTPSGLARKLRDARELMRREPERDFREIPSRDFATFEDDVRWLLEQLQAVGVRQLVVVDLTRPELQLPVVRAVIPGLEGSDNSDDYGPGARARAVREVTR